VPPSSGVPLAFGRRFAGYSTTTRTKIEHQDFVTLEHVTKQQQQQQPDTDEQPPSPTVSILKLNRPKANAMGFDFLRQLQDRLDDLSSPASGSGISSRCLVVYSELPKVFSAGADLKERATMSLDETLEFVCDLRRTFQRVADLPIPTVAAVRGAAFGGGFELALACDIIVASSNHTTLGLTETSLAIVPGAGGTQRLPRLVGTAKAKELIFTAARLSGQDAYELGIVQHVVDDPDRVLDKAMEVAWKIASNGPIAVQAAKYAIVKGMEQPELDRALEVERQAYQRVLLTKDRIEGLTAFREKREPHYTGE